jgi:uncharacterized protein (DUF885 family)
MRHLNTGFASFVLAGLACVSISSCSAEVLPTPDASAELAAIGDAIWDFGLERDFTRRLREGLPVERLPQIGFEAAEEAAAFQEGVLLRARSIDQSALSRTETMALQSVIWDAEMEVEGLQYFWLQGVLTPYRTPLRPLSVLFATLPLANDEDLDRYITLARQIPDFVGQLQEVAQGQLDRGVVTSRENMPTVVALVRASIVVPEQGPFWVSDDRLSAFPPERVSAFRTELASIVEGEVNPALSDLLEFLQGAYGDQAPDGVGISQYPDGPDYYLYLTRLNTTMDVTPEEVQQVGYALLDEFEVKMAEIREELGWAGTREEFHDHLRTDPRYFPESPDEVAERLQAAGDAMWAVVDQYFEVLPEAPFGVQRLAPELEPSMTYGYYQVPTAIEPGGYYMYNGSKLDERSRLPHTAIALHELVPGHHFQINRQWENESLPSHRREAMYTAYIEGWGSYSSFLGLEAGLLEDPLDLYGLYILESFLASRLVVDPGMNYFGMTLEEGRQFMRDRTLESEAQIATETLRYAADNPGQALGYQMGKWKFLELRARAEAALGDDFDIRRFHEALLADGAHPMMVVERHIDRWIAEEKGP